MDQKLDKNVQESLIRLCKKLQSSLHTTEKSLEIAKQRYEQIQTVRQPWTLPKTKQTELQVECNCKSADIVQISNSDEQILLDNITETLNSAQLLRTANPSKSSTKLSKKQKDIKCSKSVPISMKSSKQSVIDLHKPSCSLYNSLPEKSSLDLTEALTICKIPTVLTNTLKLTGEFLLNTNSKKSTIKSKQRFLQLLEKQNQTLWSSHEVENFTVYSFPKYISTLQSLENNDKPMEVVNPWLLYKNVQDLQDFAKHRDDVITTLLWDDILQCIRNDLIPTLENADLDFKHKLYMYKIIKTITNFTVCTIPNVPIFRINVDLK